MEHFVAIIGLAVVCWIIYRIGSSKGKSPLCPLATRQSESGFGPAAALGIGAGVGALSGLLGGGEPGQPGGTKPKVMDLLSKQEREQLDRLSAQFYSELFGLGGGIGGGGMPAPMPPALAGGITRPPMRQPPSGLPHWSLRMQGRRGMFGPSNIGPLETSPVQLELLRRLMGG